MRTLLAIFDGLPFTSNGLIRRLLHLAAVVIAVSVLTFVLVDLLPGDAAFEVAGQNASLDEVAAIREELGLNRNILVRYGAWLADAAAGDLGRSFHTREPVWDAIVSRLPVTLELLVLSQVLALALAVPVGIFCAYRAESRMDRFLNSVAFATVSVPVFIMALLLIYMFSLRLRWLPATGYLPLPLGIWANLRTMVMPAASIALVEWVALMRVLRSDLIATLQEDFILMARAKGLPAVHILLRHALRPSMFTLITILGLHIGHLIGGAVIVEWIFALPGMGRLLVTAIFGRDAVTVQGCILFVTVGYVMINFCVDLLYAVLDPRIRAKI